jgi:acyl-CoA synthetase (AMP-forming)/AMP-acid ligase II
MTDAFELPSTLVQALQRRAAHTPERLALRFLAETEEQGVVLSYRELDQRARTIAAALQAQADSVIARCCCSPAARITSRRFSAACTPG